MRIRRNFRSREGSKTADSFGEAEVRAKQRIRKGPSGYESRIREPDTRAGYESRIRVRGEQTWRIERAMEDKEGGGASLLPHQIIDFTPAPTPAPAQPVLSHSFPYPPTPLQ